jgi:hypothetical protein
MFIIFWPMTDLHLKQKLELSRSVRNTLELVRLISDQRAQCTRLQLMESKTRSKRYRAFSCFGLEILQIIDRENTQIKGDSSMVALQFKISD